MFGNHAKNSGHSIYWRIYTKKYIYRKALAQLFTISREIFISSQKNKDASKSYGLHFSGNINNFSQVIFFSTVVILFFSFVYSGNNIFGSMRSIYCLIPSSINMWQDVKQHVLCQLQNPGLQTRTEQTPASPAMTRISDFVDHSSRPPLVLEH